MSLEDEPKYDREFVTAIGGLLQTLHEDYDVEHVRFEHFPFNNETCEEVYRTVRDLVKNDEPTNTGWTSDKALYLSSDLVYWNYMWKVKKMTEDELLATKDANERVALKWALANGHYESDKFDTLVSMFGLEDKSWVRKLTLDNIAKHNLAHELESYHALTYLDITNEVGGEYKEVRNYLFDMPKLTNLLRGLNNLTTLHMGACDSYIKDFSPLGQLTQLTNLKLYHCQIDDVSSFCNLINLTHLNLQNNKIRDVTPLSQLTNLLHLNVSCNYIRNVSSLAALTKLVHLDLSWNRIKDISCVSNLLALEHLFLCANGFSDIAPISGLTKLQTLAISLNNVKDISTLSNLTELTCLCVNAHTLSDTSVLSKFTKLTQLDLLPVKANLKI